MNLKKFQAVKYRNIEECDISFSNGINVLCGSNAQGKTNVLEGIYFFSRGKSFRGAGDKELLKFGEEAFSLGIEFEDKRRSHTLKYIFDGKERKRYHNGVKENKVSDVLGYFKAVIFYPEHLQLIKGGPSERRNFLDVAVAQWRPEYYKYYSDYKKVLENRNFLLKCMQRGMYTDPAETEVWNEAMARTAAKINIMRREYLEGLEKYASVLQRDISGKRENIEVYYISDVDGENEEDTEKKYREILSENIKRECEAGVSLFGIHRDDIDIRINGKSSRYFASQGQQRSTVLSLKMAEGEMCFSSSGEYPVFLLDDVLSELDERRRDYILSLGSEKQFIITMCEDCIHSQNKNVITAEMGSFREYR